jgi:hypothetical protein
MQIPLHVQRLFRALPLPDKSMAFFVSTRRLLDFLRLMEFGRFRFVSGHEATGINSYCLRLLDASEFRFLPLLVKGAYVFHMSNQECYVLRNLTPIFTK